MFWLGSPCSTALSTAAGRGVGSLGVSAPEEPWVPSVAVSWQAALPLPLSPELDHPADLACPSRRLTFRTLRYSALPSAVKMSSPATLETCHCFCPSFFLSNLVPSLACVILLYHGVSVNPPDSFSSLSSVASISACSISLLH